MVRDDRLNCKEYLLDLLERLLEGIVSRFMSGFIQKQSLEYQFLPLFG